MMKTIPAILSTILLALVLSGCGGNREPLKVGAEQSPEDQVIAELLAQLAEAADIPVKRRIGLGSGRVTFEALKKGEIDLYPESTGAGLALLGLAQSPDPEAESTLSLLREQYAPLGLGWGDPLGFRSTPGLAMLRERAQALGIDSYSDLAGKTDRLALGVTSDFRRDPVNGLAPLARQYGLQFPRIAETEPRDRFELYDLLLQEEIDLSLVYSSDPQIELFNLETLEDDLTFFPPYESAIVYRKEAVERFPALKGILNRIAGKIGDSEIQALTRRVTVRGEDPGEVVRAELIRLGLVDGDIVSKDRQSLNLAVSPSANADGEAGTVLRLLRRSFLTSKVNLVRSNAPLGAVRDGSARLALVSAPAFFAPGSIDPATGRPPLQPGVEAVALVGTSFLTIFSLNGDIERLEEASLIATGPTGTSGFRAAQSILDGLGLTADLKPVEGDTPVALADALMESGADVVILMQPIGNSTALELLRRGLGVIGLENWNQGNNRIVFPYLQPARIFPSDYERLLTGGSTGTDRMPGFTRPVDTLSTQLVLAGPAPQTEAILSSQGPGATFNPHPLPLTNQTVESINAAIGGNEDIYPILPQAAALSPQLPKPEAPLNPSPAATLLTVVAVGLLVCCAWLMLRPARDGES